MIADFTFKLSDLTAWLTDSNQWEWRSCCTPGIQGIPFDDFIRGASSGDSRVELSVTDISECDLRLAHVARDFGEQPGALEVEQELSAAQTSGTADAMILATSEGLLDVRIGLRPQRYELFRNFVMLNFGRLGLIGRISHHFPGFAAAPSKGGEIIPSRTEFLNGRPYLVLGDASLKFGPAPAEIESLARATRSML